MAILTADASIEEWLAGAAEEWFPLADREYRDLVARWRDVFASDVDGENAIQSNQALATFESRLPVDLYLFNGVAVPRAAVVSTRRPTGYRAVGLRSLDHALANQLDLTLVDSDFSFCCVCTHEWQSMAHPIFVTRAT